MQNSLLIAGGGTGGHVFPALAVAQEWLGGREARSGQRRSVVFVGTERGMEARLVPQAGLPLEMIRVAGLKGIGGTKLLRNAAMLPAGLWDSEKIIRRHRFSAGVRRWRLRFRADDAARRDAPDPDRGFRAQRRAGLHESRAGGHGHARRGGASRKPRRALARKAVVTGCPVRKEFFAMPRKGASRAVPIADHRRQPRRAADQSGGD